MSHHWDIHDFNDPDDDPITRFRHLAGDYGLFDLTYDDGFFQTFYDDFEDDQKYPRNPQDEMKRTLTGHMMSLYDTRYFVPQWDEQMLGPSWREKRAKWNFNKPPKPLPITDARMTGAFRYCEQCQLTWLVGHDGLEGHHHPLHLAWEMKEEHIDQNRYGMSIETSLIIHIHGDAVPYDQEPRSPNGNRAGYGIFFGNGSKFNTALPGGDERVRCDAEGATVEAIYVALTVAAPLIRNARQIFLRNLKRAEMLKIHLKSRATQSGMKSTSATRIDDNEPSDTASTKDTEVEADWEDTSDEDEEASSTELDKVPFRIVFVTDNAKVVNNICRNYKHWKEKRGKLKRKGRSVKNGPMYLPLCKKISELEETSGFTRVKWYLVPKEYNKGAVELARLAVDGTTIDGATRNNP